MQLVKSDFQNTLTAVFFTFLVFLVSCTSEPDFENYSIEIQNNSGQELEIFTYFNNVLSENISLKNEENGLNCRYSSEVFLAYRSGQCQIDSIKVIFSNNKGYLASLKGSIGYDFLEVTSNGTETSGPFERHSTSIREIENNRYEFEITQEDYNNAHELPE